MQKKKIIKTNDGEEFFFKKTKKYKDKEKGQQQSKWGINDAAEDVVSVTIFF